MVVGSNTMDQKLTDDFSRGLVEDVREGIIRAEQTEAWQSAFLTGQEDYQRSE